MSEIMTLQPRRPARGRADDAVAGVLEVSDARDLVPDRPPGRIHAVNIGAVSSEKDALSSAWNDCDPILVQFFRRFAIIAGIAVVAIGSVSLFGWLVGIRALTSIYADWVFIKVNTALGLITAGSALSLLAAKRSSLLAGVYFLNIFVVALGSATLIEYIFDWDIGIDQLLIVEPPGAIGTANSGRMAILTAVAFIACGSAQLALTTRNHRWIKFTELLVFSVVVTFLIAFFGYIFGAKEFYTFADQFTGVAIGASLAFILLGIGIIACEIEHSFLHWLASPNSGGVMLRRMLPLAIILPTVIVWLQLLGQSAGLFSTVEFGAATVAVATIISVTGALVWCAVIIDRLDSERLSSAEKIRQLNVTLADRISALQTVNKELEVFSYAASHVFLAPLRAMNGFSRILLEDYDNCLDSEGKRLLGVLRSSALEMAELVDNILGFLRLGRNKLSLSLIDMGSAVQFALNELAPQTHGRKLNVQIAPLPKALGDAAMIQRVWTHLLDNAVKFTAVKAEGKINVGAIPGEGETIFYVCDNGAGFDMQFAGKLFGVFSRLHGSEFPGNGIGLAIVQRIITRHGGRVWAEGKPNEGATFYFSLPAKEKSYA